MTRFSRLSKALLYLECYAINTRAKKPCQPNKSGTFWVKILLLTNRQILLLYLHLILSIWYVYYILEFPSWSHFVPIAFEKPPISIQSQNPPTSGCYIQIYHFLLQKNAAQGETHCIDWSLCKPELTFYIILLCIKSPFTFKNYSLSALKHPYMSNHCSGLW